MFKTVKDFVLPHPIQSRDTPIEYDTNGKPIVFRQRWYILAALCSSYFTWNFQTYRTNPLVSEYAVYFDQPNEFQAPPDLGIDFLLIFGAFTLMLIYPLGGVLVDTYGIQMMVYGSIGQALNCWWWFLSFDNYYSVLFSKLLSNLSGLGIGCSLLRVSSNWFPEEERPLAVALGAMVASLGGGVTLIVSPLFIVGDDIINPRLKSCRLDELEDAGLDTNNLPRECNEIAEEAFCCAADTNIDGLNFFMAMFATAIAIYTFIVTTDAPRTPPSKSGAVRKGPSIKKTFSLMFSNSNYTLICLTDFLSSGPPLVLFNTVDRVFPPAVSDYSVYAAGGGYLAAIPIGAYFAIKLAENKAFYEMTAAGYISGFIAWTLITILVFIDTETADYIVVSIAGLAIVAYAVWTVAVYELKMEYVFSSEYAIQGFVIAVDRVVINMAATVYTAAIPPERYTGDAITGRQFTFLVGAVSMLLGTAVALALPHKKRYRRKMYEDGIVEQDALLSIRAHSKVISSISPENTL